MLRLVKRRLVGMIRALETADNADEDAGTVIVIPRKMFVRTNFPPITLIDQGALASLVAREIGRVSASAVPVLVLAVAALA